MKAVRLHCGCVVLAEHRGTEYVTCPGGGLKPSDKPTVDSQQLVECPGGRRHRVTAQVTVQYESEVVG